ncbi:hypothetical protein [Helicobacter sp.]|uniref:hypothetical protein n=1 Tax=Helicobacter sp. TaxID=218 RepID=UPI0019ABE8F2|nr:hypothetical protein [Helicobacter sp.]MBD5165241.1 hypothetical protein [Helicobacter sp.]
MRFHLSLRGANEMSNEAIHNKESHLFILDSLFDLLQVHYYRLPRKFCKLARNDKIAYALIPSHCEALAEVIHNPTCFSKF